MNKNNILINHIESSILEFGQKFINPKYRHCFFGSEGSVKCYIYHLIAKNEEFLKDIHYTNDDNEKIGTWRLHAELPTFEKINSKTGRFDICIINPDGEAKDNLACIEIEWVEKIQNSYEELKSTLDKLSHPENEVENGYIIILNDHDGFMPVDIENLKNLKEKYNQIKFFVFDAVKNKVTCDSELTKIQN